MLRRPTVRHWGRVGRLLAALVSLGAAGLSSAASEPGLAALAGDGRVLLLRHAQTTPGVGDPPGFDLADCATQRNLDPRGLAEADRLGAALAAAGVEIGRVMSSRWCRARETAERVLAAAGVESVPVEASRLLDTLWDQPPPGTELIAEAQALAADWRGPGALVLVSHGVTLRPLFGVSLGQGGYAVLEPDPRRAEGFRVIAEGRP